MKPIIIVIQKFVKGSDPSTGEELTFTLNEEWPMLLNEETNECYFAKNARLKGQILKDETDLWTQGAYYGTFN